VKLIPGTPLPVDIDQTLVLYKDINKAKKGRIPFEYGGKIIYLTTHDMNIACVKDCKSAMIAWSANGEAWAKEVITGLGLLDYFDYYMQKPKEYIDDKDVSKWMNSRIWIDEA